MMGKLADAAGEDTLAAENRRLRRELEDRDRIIQALATGRAHITGNSRTMFVWIPKREYLADPRPVRRDQGEDGFRLFVVPDRDGYQGLGELPEWARGLGF